MIYIQSKSKELTISHHFDCACALYGAIDTGVDYKFVTFEEVQSGKWDNLIKRNLFVGSVEFMREVFSRIGKTDVRVPRNSNRKCDFITLGEAFERTKDGSKLFIKPIEIKLFTGLVLDGFRYSCLESLSKDTQLMSYGVFDGVIQSEYRIYVLNNKIIDSHCYSGSFEVIPDFNYVRNIIEENTDFPVSYTIDIGILDNGKNVVVEFNDMWAIGNYGVPNDLYIRMLKERYFEITGGFKYI